MRRLITLAALAGVAAISAAQSPDYYPANLSFRLGAAFPLESQLSDKVGRSLFALGVDYRLNRPLLADGESYISVDWLFGTTSGRKGNVFPFNINHRWYTNTGIDAGPGRRSYFFLGVGGVVVDVGTADTVLGARGGVGVELSESLFAEGTVWLSDRASGNVRNTSIGVFIGYRF